MTDNTFIIRSEKPSGGSLDWFVYWARRVLAVPFNVLFFLGLIGGAIAVAAILISTVVAVLVALAGMIVIGLIVFVLFAISISVGPDRVNDDWEVGD